MNCLCCAESLLIKGCQTAENFIAQSHRKLAEKAVAVQILSIGTFLLTDIRMMRTWQSASKLVEEARALSLWFDDFDATSIPEADKESELEVPGDIQSTLAVQNLWGVANVGGVDFPFIELCCFANKSILPDQVVYTVCRAAGPHPGALNELLFVVDPAAIAVRPVARRVKAFDGDKMVFSSPKKSSIVYLPVNWSEDNHHWCGVLFDFRRGDAWVYGPLHDADKLKDTEDIVASVIKDIIPQDVKLRMRSFGGLR